MGLTLRGSLRSFIDWIETFGKREDRLRVSWYIQNSTQNMNAVSKIHVFEDSRTHTLWSNDGDQNFIIFVDSEYPKLADIHRNVMASWYWSCLKWLLKKSAAFSHSSWGAKSTANYKNSSPRDASFGKPLLPWRSKCPRLNKSSALAFPCIRQSLK